MEGFLDRAVDIKVGQTSDGPFCTVYERRFKRKSTKLVTVQGKKGASLVDVVKTALESIS